MKTNVQVWRTIARAVIARVIRENKDKAAGDIAGVIKAAYPFGKREGEPYKIWLGEVKRAGVIRAIKDKPNKPGPKKRP